MYYVLRSFGFFFSLVSNQQKELNALVGSLGIISFTCPTHVLYPLAWIWNVNDSLIHKLTVLPIEAIDKMKQFGIDRIFRSMEYSVLHQFSSSPNPLL